MLRSGCSCVQLRFHARRVRQALPLRKFTTSNGAARRRPASGPPMTVFASEVAGICGLNPHARLHDILLSLWRRTRPREFQVACELVAREGAEVFDREAQVQQAIDQHGLGDTTLRALQAARDASTASEVTQAVSSLEKDLVERGVPPEVAQGVVEQTSSAMRKEYGQRQEAGAGDAYEVKTQRQLTDRNAKFMKRLVCQAHGITLFVGGRVDGLADGRVVEIKARTHRFMDPLPPRDLVQLQVYLYVTAAHEGEVVEQLMKEGGMETKVTLVKRDVLLWEQRVRPPLVHFARVAQEFMSDRVDLHGEFLRGQDAARAQLVQQLLDAGPKRRGAAAAAAAAAAATGVARATATPPAASKSVTTAGAV